MFDLPVNTKEERREATKFRKKLLDLGFVMSQYSVYLKYCYSAEKAETVTKFVEKQLPKGGKVDLLSVTDRQFAKMKRFYAKKPIKIERRPKQLHLF